MVLGTRGCAGAWDGAGIMIHQVSSPPASDALGRSGSLARGSSPSVVTRSDDRSAEAEMAQNAKTFACILLSPPVPSRPCPSEGQASEGGDVRTGHTAWNTSLGVPRGGGPGISFGRSTRGRGPAWRQSLWLNPQRGSLS